MALDQASTVPRVRPICPRADLGGSPACLGLAASILSVLRRSDRRVRPPITELPVFYTKKVATPFGSRGFPRFPSRGGPAIGVSSNTIRHTASDTFRHCDTAPSTAGLIAGFYLAFGTLTPPWRSTNKCYLRTAPRQHSRSRIYPARLGWRPGCRCRTNLALVRSRWRLSSGSRVPMASHLIEPRRIFSRPQAPTGWRFPRRG